MKTQLITFVKALLVAGAVALALTACTAPDINEQSSINNDPTFCGKVVKVTDSDVDTITVTLDGDRADFYVDDAKNYKTGQQVCGLENMQRVK